MILYESTHLAIPEKYRKLNAGLVAAVTIPMDDLVQMKIGDKINLTLPIGQFEVVHGNRIEHENGDLTWVGYLNREAKRYWVIITLGEQGSIGTVMTPGGVYNIDLDNGRNWLVDVSSSTPNRGSVENGEGLPAPFDRQLVAETNLGGTLPAVD